MPGHNWMSEVTPAHIEKFLAIHGRKGVKTLSLLGRINRLKEALQTPVGQELLQEIMTKMEVRLQKILDRESTDQEEIEYNTLRELFLAYTDKIVKYYNLAEKVKKESE